MEYAESTNVNMIYNQISPVTILFLEVLELHQNKSDTSWLDSSQVEKKPR